MPTVTSDVLFKIAKCHSQKYLTMNSATSTPKEIAKIYLFLSLYNPFLYLLNKIISLSLPKDYDLNNKYIIY